MASVVVTQHGRTPWEIFTLDGALDPDAFMQFVSDKRYVQKRRQFAHEVSFVNGKEIRPDVSREIWDAMAPHLPAAYEDYVFEGPVRYVMYALVDAGQGFPLHTDSGCVYDQGLQRFSKFTVLTYLNDDFEGGGTVFYNDAFEKIAEIEPRKGRTLCFDIDLFHAGESVSSGTKMWIGTELVCRKVASTL